MPSLAYVSDLRSPDWPAAENPAPDARASDAIGKDDALVKAQKVCVGSSVWSAGRMGESLAFRVERRGNRLAVGYFVFWSSERPWGGNALSFSVTPALLIDSFYSHGLFVLPGLQRVVHGPGDVEGVLVVYEIERGRLRPLHAIADDEFHREVRLSRDDVIADDGSVIVMTEAWSHQLGARRAARRVAEASELRCFEGGGLRPLTRDLADAFRLGSPEAPERARPAWQSAD
jgi:hypothetical protein